jgi:hypothetical protein
MEKRHHEGYQGVIDRQFIDIQIFAMPYLSLYIIPKLFHSQTSHLSHKVPPYPSEGTGIGSGTTAGVAFLPGVDGAFLPLGVDGAVATAVNVVSLATSCARRRIFGTCNPVMSDLIQRKDYMTGHMFPVAPGDEDLVFRTPRNRPAVPRLGAVFRFHLRP